MPEWFHKVWYDKELVFPKPDPLSKEAPQLPHKILALSLDYIQQFKKTNQNRQPSTNAKERKPIFQTKLTPSNWVSSPNLQQRDSKGEKGVPRIPNKRNLLGKG